MEIDPPNESVGFQIKEKDLFKAAETGESSIFKSLSEEHLSKSLKLRNEDGRSLLHVAVSSARPEVVKVLSASVDESVVNSTDEEGWGPIHSAASIGNLEIMEILLSKGANVNVKNDGGRTALHYAASKGWLKIAELLISHGAEVDATDRTGQTPLMNAVICHNKEVALLLIRHGADVDIEDNEGYTVLGRASNDFRPKLIDAATAMLEG
ncbi:hypothetical protein V6N13_121240 [Hibiscus sabdariffa]|uniref:Uncharacterized protein n=1 Tax=Hibiscus sabdariffa TaxID=183260 RepID=A0ABR2PEA2_9ROSI